MNDISRELFNSHSAGYTHEVDEAVSFSGLKSDFFTRAKADYLIKLVDKHFGASNDLKVLDLGCGIGTYEALLKNRIGSITGIDVSEKSIELARTHNPDNTYEVYDGRTLPFEDESFDVVFAICVMHHVPVDLWPRFVAEAMRVARPSGLFAIFEHNPWNPLTQHVVSSCEFDDDAVLLTPKKIRRAFKEGKVSAREQRSRYMLAIPPMGKVLGFTDSLFDRIPVGAQYAFYSIK